jgi:hypothetical protein
VQTAGRICGVLVRAQGAERASHGPADCPCGAPGGGAPKPYRPRRRPHDVRQGWSRKAETALAGSVYDSPAPSGETRTLAPKTERGISREGGYFRELFVFCSLRHSGIWARLICKIEVWLADMPDHPIHFNGDRLLARARDG